MYPRMAVAAVRVIIKILYVIIIIIAILHFRLFSFTCFLIWIATVNGALSLLGYYEKNIEFLFQLKPS